MQRNNSASCVVHPCSSSSPCPATEQLFERGITLTPGRWLFHAARNSRKAVSVSVNRPAGTSLPSPRPFELGDSNALRRFETLRLYSSFPLSTFLEKPTKTGNPISRNVLQLNRYSPRADFSNTVIRTKWRRVSSYLPIVGRASVSSNSPREYLREIAAPCSQCYESQFR